MSASREQRVEADRCTIGSRTELVVEGASARLDSPFSRKERYGHLTAAGGCALLFYLLWTPAPASKVHGFALFLLFGVGCVIFAMSLSRDYAVAFDGHRRIVTVQTEGLFRRTEKAVPYSEVASVRFQPPTAVSTAIILETKNGRDIKLTPSDLRADSVGEVVTRLRLLTGFAGRDPSTGAVAHSLQVINEPSHARLGGNWHETPGRTVIALDGASLFSTSLGGAAFALIGWIAIDILRGKEWVLGLAGLATSLSGLLFFFYPRFQKHVVIEMKARQISITMTNGLWQRRKSIRFDQVAAVGVVKGTPREGDGVDYWVGFRLHSGRQCLIDDSASENVCDARARRIADQTGLPFQSRIEA